MGYLNNIISDAKGLTVVPAATLAIKSAMPLTEVPTPFDDGPVAEQRMPTTDSTQSEVVAPADEQRPSVVPDSRPTTTDSLSHGAGKQSDPGNPPLPSLLNTPLHTTRRDLFVTEEPKGIEQDGQQSVPVAGQGLTQTPNSSLPANVKPSHPKQVLTLNMDHPQGRDVLTDPELPSANREALPAGDEYDVAISPSVKSLEPVTNREKAAGQTAEFTTGEEPVAVARDEIIPPPQSGPEDVPCPPESVKSVTPEGHDATRPMVTAPRIEPRVHIGQIDIVVMAPEPPVAPRADARPGNSDFASRNYLRGL